MRLVLPALLLCAMAVMCQGKVFRRWRAGMPGAHAVRALGGRLAYSAPVSVNNGAGDLSVFIFEEALDGVLDKLPGGVGAGGTREQSLGNMVVRTVSAPGKRAWWLIYAPEQARAGTIVFKLEQDADEYARSREPPDHGLPGVPSYPAAEPLFLFRDRAGRTAFCVSRTPDALQAVRASVASQMAAAGWAPALPRGPRGTSFMMYLRDNEICCTMVDGQSETGQTRITLLHKIQDLK